MSHVLITGATGRLGGVVIREVIRKIGAENVSALVRDPSKAADLQALKVTLLKGDYSDPATLEQAFKGIEKLYFVSANDLANVGDQHRNVVKAAVAANVRHIIYVSGIRALDGTSSIPVIANVHEETEELIRKSGLKYTILMHGLYADILADWIPPGPTMESGEFRLPGGNGKAVYPTREDLALAGAAVITGSGHENKTYSLTGNRSSSFRDVAEKLTKLTEVNVRYVPIAQEEFLAQLKAQGADESIINTTVAYLKAFELGEFDHHDPTLERLLGRMPTTLIDFLKTVYRLPDDSEDADTIDTYYLK